jgi:hypothetical protein
MNVFAKPYARQAKAREAANNLAWLSTLDSGVRLPRWWNLDNRQLQLERLPGRHATPDDLTVVADALGRLHHAAHTRCLHAAALDESFVDVGITITDFVTPRRAALAREPLRYEALPVALYKDTNVRNVLITGTEVALVDFDDLTLAPFGYDLAKLVVSTAMTHGIAGDVPAALAAYNAQVGPYACPPERLHAYAELHHTLTVPYLGRNGYQHPWPNVRPGSPPAIINASIQE